MNAIGFILARGGSKDIPSKNLKLLGGKPLLAWTIEAAVQSGICNEVWVATDNNDIRQLAWSYDASTFDLSQEMTADNVYSAEVAHYVMSNLNSIIRKNEHDIFAFLYASSQFCLVVLILFMLF